MNGKIECSKCPDKGSCCGPVPFEKGFVEKYKDKIQVKSQKMVWDDNRDVFVTEDLGCIFLNRQTRDCMIYEFRPEICKAYGNSDDVRIACPYFKKNGNPRSEARTKQIFRWHKNNNLILSKKPKISPFHNHRS